MAAKIICPICDEELGNCIDDIPEKCPICDTRKHEILQEIRDKQEEENGQKITTFMVENSPSEVLSIHKEKEEEKSSFSPGNIEEEISIFPQANTKKISYPTSISVEKPTNSEIKNNQEIVFSKGENEDVLFSKEENEDVLFSKEENEDVLFFEEKIEEETKEEMADIVFNKEVREENFYSAPEVYEEKEEGVDFDSSEKEEENLPVVRQEKISEEIEEKKELSEKKRKESKPYKSGASTLEKLPIGFKYCSQCNACYDKNDSQIYCIHCPQIALKTVEKGFPPGHYLVLYNHEKKAISYFCLEAEGSTFIGRSSERGSPKDIDLSIAWKNYYDKQQFPSEEFKERMTLLKGISRKHALIRYSKEDQKYILFHLSDKNYTLIQTPNGEKRVRAPKNRNKIELQPGTLISLGNQKEFIILRYKIISIEQL